MRELFKRPLALLLAAALLLPLAACGDETGEEDGASGSGEYHYAMTSLTPSPAVMSVSDLVMLEDIPYVVAYNGGYQAGLYRLDLETGDLEQLHTAGDAMLSIAPDRQGGLWAVESLYHEDAGESEITLRRLDADGGETGTAELPAPCEYVSDIATDTDGNLYVTSGSQVFVVTAGGDYAGAFDATSYIAALATTGDGRVATYDYGESAFCVVDPEALAYGDIYPCAEYIQYLMDGDSSYAIYFYNETGVYGYDAETGEPEELLTWLENDMSWVSFCSAIDGETLLVYESDLMILRRTEGGRDDGKTTLTLATMDLNFIVQDAVVQFNRTDGQYRVEVVDYSQYNTAEDENAGRTRLNTEIISGDAPDLIDLGGLPVQQYAARGLLADLGELMDGDGDISRGDFTASVMDALEVDGGLYSMIPAYSVSSVVGRTSQVGQDMGWTVSDYQDLLERTGGTAFANLSQSDMLALMFSATESLYVDWDEGGCDFTIDAFAELLEMAAAYPAEINESNYSSEITQLSNGTALLSTIYIADNTGYQLYEAILGDDITFIGFPTPDGTGGSTIAPAAELGIMNGSDNTEGAWAFLRYLLSEEVQTGLDYYFPVMESALEATLEGYLTPEVWVDEEGEAHEISSTLGVSDGGDMVSVEITALSEQAVEKLRQLIRSLDSVQREQTGILDILQEEAAAYFSGDKSADEVAQLVQNRVSTYLQEQS